MALRTPASWIQGGSHSAENDRLTERAEISAAGIIGGGDMVVSANGTPNMSVNVAAGAAYVKGSVTATQGYYKVYNDATVNLTIAASDPSNPRIDLVVITINDSQYAGAVDSAVLQVVTGTPAASPVAPSAPANSYTLAQVSVVAAASSIDNAHITDKRTLPTRKPVVIQSDSPTTSVIVARAAAGQTGDLGQWQDSGGSVLSRVSASGHVYGFAGSFGGPSGATPSYGAALDVTALSAANIPVIVRAAASQSGDLTQWQNSAGATLFKIANDGHPFTKYLAISQSLSLLGTGAALEVTAPDNSHGAAVFRAVASQSSDITTWQDGSGNPIARISSSGNVQGTGAYTTLSDATAKDNIAALTGGLAVVKSLAPRKYDYIGGETDQIGFVAQEVAALIPEAITQFDERRLGLRTDAILAHVVLAIQQIAAKVGA